MRALPWVLSFSLLATACQCGPGSADAGREVKVRRFRAFVSDPGVSNDVDPFDLTDLSVSALVKDDAGYYVIYPTQQSPGVGDWVGVPAGPYYVTLNDYNVFTDTDAIDLGIVNLGRSSSALTDGGTQLTLDASGLKPWQQFSDTLQVTSENAGYVAINAQSYLDGQPDAGATFALFSIDYLSACNTLRSDLAPLVDASKGDTLTVTQLSSSVVDGGSTLRTLTRSASLASATMTDHGVNAFTAVFSAPAMSSHYDLDFRQSEFAALLPTVNANATAVSASVTLSALPYTADNGFYTASPDLAQLRAFDLTLDLGVPVDTGDPFPPGWPRVGTARYGTQVSIDFPDGGSRAVSADIVVTDLLPAFSSAPIRPRVSPPLDVTVNGGAADVRAQIPRTPVIAWSKPALGEPTSYIVTIYNLSRVGMGPVIVLTEGNSFETTQMSVEIPFGVIGAGGEYVFAVSSILAPGTQVTAAPFQSKLPYSSATMLTALFRVDPTPLPQP